VPFEGRYAGSLVSRQEVVKFCKIPVILSRFKAKFVKIVAVFFIVTPHCRNWADIGCTVLVRPTGREKPSG
jgi:hypothetical protein